MNYTPGGTDIPSDGRGSRENEVFIGIGSNLGPARGNFERALRSVSEFSTVLAVSSLYESDPVGPAGQPRFANAVAKTRTDLSPFELLDRLKAIEREMGRKKTARWGPRVIDLDIVFYGNLVMESDSLVIPHPRAHERRFVLEPLLEIEPDASHPATGTSLKEILSRLGDSQGVCRMEGPPAFGRP